MKYAWLLPLLLVAASTTVAAMSCNSPVDSNAIDELGDEVEGVAEGPLHRYGQPCLRCHGGFGPGEPQFAVAGTVFATPDSDIPVSGARVKVTDATGKVIQKTTNCAGNFYMTLEEYDAVFPLRAEVVCELPEGGVLPSGGAGTGGMGAGGMGAGGSGGSGGMGSGGEGGMSSGGAGGMGSGGSEGGASAGGASGSGGSEGGAGGSTEVFRRNVMGTRINREGACNECHSGKPSATSPGRIACVPVQPTVPYEVPNCLGGPK